MTSSQQLPIYDWSCFCMDSKELLGSGSFSNIFKVTEKSTNQTLALKCLSTNLEDNTSDDLLDFYENDLRKEADLLSKLSHPNILGIKGTSEEDSSHPGKFFFLLEILEETLLDRLIRWRKARVVRRQPQGLRLLPRLVIALELTKALSHLQSHNIVHCDLKPGNVGFDTQGRVKLFDFGLSVDLSQHELEEGQTEIRGTQRYMAPEIMQGRDMTLQADVFSFSVLLWELLTLQIPYGFVRSFQELFHKVVVQQERPFLKAISSRRLRAVFLRAWQPCPEDRPNFSLIERDLMEVFNENRVRFDGPYMYRDDESTAWDESSSHSTLSTMTFRQELDASTKTTSSMINKELLTKLVEFVPQAPSSTDVLKELSKSSELLDETRLRHFVSPIPTQPKTIPSRAA